MFRVFLCLKAAVNKFKFNIFSNRPGLFPVTSGKRPGLLKTFMMKCPC